MKNWFLGDKSETNFDWGANDQDLIQIIDTEIFKNRVYEKKQSVKKDDIVLDIGANVGAFTYSILKANPKKIICIEPSNNLVNTLRKNVKSDSVNVLIENSAIKSTSRQNVEIQYGDVIYKNIGDKINSISFGDLIKKYDIKYIDFMKIDCEYGEYDIFTEEHLEFLTTRVGHIAGEWHVWGMDNVVEKFKRFRDMFLSHFSNFAIYDRYDNDITAKIFDDEFITQYSDNFNHAAQFIIYLTNMKAQNMRNWFLENPINQAMPSKQESIIKINPNLQKNKRAFVIDNFYEDPHLVRQYALRQEFFDDPGYIGRRTRTQHLFPGMKEIFESIIGERISEWETYPMNGRFQHNWSGEPLVYHCDHQRWAAMIYLTPNAPPETGTTMYRHKETKIHHNSQINWAAGDGNRVFNQKTFLDRTPYEAVDVFGNIFNRLVIFDGGCIHAASEYFGSNLQDCRLWQMFFFDGEVSNIHMGA